MEVCGQFHAPAVLIPGKNVDTHLLGRWGGTRAGSDVLENKIFLFCAGNRTLDCPARRLVTTLTALLQLLQFTDGYTIQMDRQFWCRYRDNWVIGCHACGAKTIPAFNKFHAFDRNRVFLISFTTACYLSPTRDRPIQSTLSNCDLLGFILILSHVVSFSLA